VTKCMGTPTLGATFKICEVSKLLGWLGGGKPPHVGNMAYKKTWWRGEQRHHPTR